MEPTKQWMGEQALRRAELVRDTTERLQGVCAHWPPAEFRAFVERTVDRMLRHEQRTTLLEALRPVNGPGRREDDRSAGP